MTVALVRYKSAIRESCASMLIPFHLPCVGEHYNDVLFGVVTLDVLRHSVLGVQLEELSHSYADTSDNCTIPYTLRSQSGLS